MRFFGNEIDNWLVVLGVALAALGVLISAGLLCNLRPAPLDAGSREPAQEIAIMEATAPPDLRYTTMVNIPQYAAINVAGMRCSSLPSDTLSTTSATTAYTVPSADELPVFGDTLERFRAALLEVRIAFCAEMPVVDVDEFANKCRKWHRTHSPAAGR